MHGTKERSKLDVQEVVQLERLLGGDPITEGQVLNFIKVKYGAANLTQLSPKIGNKIIKRTSDFLKAVKLFHQPELPL